MRHFYAGRAMPRFPELIAVQVVRGLRMGNRAGRLLREVGNGLPPASERGYPGPAKRVKR